MRSLGKQPQGKIRFVNHDWDQRPLATLQQSHYVSLFKAFRPNEESVCELSPDELRGLELALNSLPRSPGQT